VPVASLAVINVYLISGNNDPPARRPRVLAEGVGCARGLNLSGLDCPRADMHARYDDKSRLSVRYLIRVYRAAIRVFALFRGNETPVTSSHPARSLISPRGAKKTREI